MADQPAVTPSASSAQPASTGKPAPAGKPAQKKRRRWPWILLGIFVLILLFIALLPTIASTGPVRRMVLGRVNQQINGTVGIDSWSLGWSSGFKLDGIRVADAQGKPLITIRSVTLPATVRSLLSSQKNLGAITIESPKADIILYADGTNSLTRLIKPSQAATPPAPATPSQPLSFDVNGVLSVTNGDISVQPALRPGSGQAGAAKPFLVRDLNVDVKIESLYKPTTFDVKAALGEERAALTVNGSATALHANKPGAGDIEADVAVTLAGLDLAPVAALARQCGCPVETSGVLTVQKLTAQVRGMDSIKAAGDIALKQLALSGGPLGTDQPKFDHVALAFDVSKTTRTVEINRFKFDSPVASADASGSLQLPAPGQLPKGNLTANAQLNLPALAAQLPGTLKLQKGLTVASGAVKLDVKLASDNEGAHVEVSLRAEDLAAVNAGKRIALDAPIALDLKASLTDEGLKVEAFDLASSFATLHGRGSMEKFDLEIKSDLAAALREAAKFADLGNRGAQGQATVSLHLAGAERQETISGVVTLTGLSLAGFTPRPVNLAEAKATLGAIAFLDAKNALQSINGLKVDFTATPLRDEKNMPQEVQGVKVDLTSPFVTGAITAESILLAPGQPLPALHNGRIVLKAELGDLAEFALGAGLMPANIGLLGDLDFDAGLTVDKGVVQLAPVALTVTDLDASQGKKHFRDAKVAVSGSIEADPAARSAKVRDLKCEISAGSVAVESVDVPDWAATPAGVTATIAGGLDIERALASFKDFAALPAGLKVAGQARFTLKDVSLADKQSVSLDASVTALKVTPATGPAIEEPNLSITAAADVAPATQTLTLNSLAVKSSFYSLDAKGSLADWGKTKMLTLDGTQQRDWDKIGPLVAAFSGKPVEMSGKEKMQTLHVVTSLGAEGTNALLAATVANAVTHIDRVKYMGLDVAAFDVPVQVKDSVATLDVTATVNGGALMLPAKVDATKATPVLTLPPNTAVLTDAQITPAMADESLAKAVPIFKGCTATQGAIGLDSQSLNVPLGPEALQKGQFEGGLHFKGVRMSATGQLQSILSAVNLTGGGGSDLARVQDGRVPLSLRNGRIYQGPMQITLAGFTLTISGSVGLVDKTLDMGVEIPITLTMVGGQNDVYKVLKGEVLRVAITGTTDNPQYSVKDSLKKLMADAAKKLLEQKLREQGGGLIPKGLPNIFK